MSKIISQNDFDTMQNVDSIKIFFERFHISSILKSSNVRKTKGVAPVQILIYAFALVFKNKSMYMDMLLSSNSADFAKDTYYRFMKSIHINWNRFTSMLAVNISRDVIIPATSDDRINALIVVDSMFSRSCSQKVEMLAKIYDHAKKSFLYGFRMLTLGWTDGTTYALVLYASCMDPFIKSFAHLYANPSFRSVFNLPEKTQPAEINTNSAVASIITFLKPVSMHHCARHRTTKMYITLPTSSSYFFLGVL